MNNTIIKNGNDFEVLKTTKRNDRLIKLLSVDLLRTIFNEIAEDFKIKLGINGIPAVSYINAIGDLKIASNSIANQYPNMNTFLNTLSIFADVSKRELFEHINIDLKIDTEKEYLRFMDQLYDHIITPAEITGVLNKVKYIIKKAN